MYFGFLLAFLLPSKNGAKIFAPDHFPSPQIRPKRTDFLGIRISGISGISGILLWTGVCAGPLLSIRNPTVHNLYRVYLFLFFYFWEGLFSNLDGNVFFVIEN